MIDLLSGNVVVPSFVLISYIPILLSSTYYLEGILSLSSTIAPVIVWLDVVIVVFPILLSSVDILSVFYLMLYSIVSCVVVVPIILS